VWGTLRAETVFSGDMPADDLGDWLTERFGARNERLVTDPGLDPVLATTRAELIDRIEELNAERSEYETKYRKAVAVGRETDDDERLRELARLARAAKRGYERRTDEMERSAIRLAAVLTVEALRGVDDRDDADAVESAVLEELSDTVMDGPAALDGLLDLSQVETVRAATAFDGDPLDSATEDPVTGHPPPSPPPTAVDLDEIDLGDGVDDEVDAGEEIEVDVDVDVDIEDY
jgi:hypothetical protein